MKEPESMDEVVYFTRRTIGSGKAAAWVYKQPCPKCGKEKMGKPVVKGKVKIRAKEYECPACSHTIEKKEYEESLTCEVKYTCPHCQHEGEAAVPFKRKKIAMINEETGKKKMVDAVRIPCSKCGKNIDITKKMK